MLPRSPMFLLLLSILFLQSVRPETAASQPDKGYDVRAYAATIRLDRAHDSLNGVVTMTARATDVVDSILQHAKYLTVDSVLVDGQRSSWNWADTAMGVYYVQTPSSGPVNGIRSGTSFTVTTYYHGPGKPEQNGAAWGGVTDNDTMIFAMGVGFAAPYTSCTRHWLPCYDLPDDKADTVDLTFLSDPGDITASNGLLVSNTVANGTRAMHWRSTNPIASYLLTFASGPYTVSEIPNSIGKPFEVFALEHDSARAATDMLVRTREALAFYDSLFAPYPFEKVGYVITPIGSMEHQTLISLDQGTLDTNYTTAAHELAHQWWGDWVTCKTFDDAWLNEGFATFCESLVLERFFGEAQYLKRQQGNVSASISATIPLFGAPTALHHTNNYPGVIYQKGAAVLGMLRDYLGDPLFFRALRAYGNAHAYSVATSADLEHDVEQATGQDLSWFFRQWVYAIGTPKIYLGWTPTATGATLLFRQEQDSTKYPHFRTPFTVEGISAGGDTVRTRVWMDSTTTSSATANFGFSPVKLTLDPDRLVIKQLDSVRKLAAVIPEAPHPYELRVRPNPAEGHLFLSLGSDQPMHGWLTIADAAAHTVLKERVEGSEGQAIDTSRLSSGTYFVVLREDSGAEAHTQFVVRP